ncbi:MAG: thioredoxin domain-containing protein [Nitrospina sp.]|nr:thioredoxin domain-containing protein [Nitrospina sp.]
MSDSYSPNRLKNEISPYLLQHAGNPVDWYPWGPEALKKAEAENKPIFLSIGYSACHWCHVMAHESFENDEIAKIMNEKFVNIKVDREERPDVDALYMKALVELTGHGGWPLSMFLTPDQNPYLGGTYYPPFAKYNRPGFAQVLQQAHDLYTGNKDQLEARSQKFLQKLSLENRAGTAQGVPTEELIRAAVEKLSGRFDEDFGGFGTGMKFPEPMHYNLLLRHWAVTGDSLNILDKSLTGMAEGGLFDQLGGGFHRYSTDRKWRVPHFEKMLYDNGLLAKLFLDMFQATKQDIYQTIPRETFSWLSREMTSPDGAFYASQDADSEGKEGTYYTWELKEVMNLLGPKHAKVFSRAYGLIPRGHVDGRNVLHVNEKVEPLAEAESIPIFEADHILKKGRETLFHAREKRPKPDRDEKIITAWNGLMITALAHGSSVLGDSSYLDSATRCAEFIWSRQWVSGKLLRVYKDGQSKINGCLDDYAYFMEAMVALYEAGFDSKWIVRARELAEVMLEEFWDEREGGFFLSGRSGESLISKLKNPADEALPSANAVAALVLLKLGRLTGDETLIRKTEEIFDAYRSMMERSPAGFTGILSAMSASNLAPVEVVFAGPRDHSSFDEMWKTLHTDYRPNKVVLWKENETTGALLPLADGKTAEKGKPTAYLCQNNTCHAPVQSGTALNKLLARPQEIRLNIFDEEKKNAQILEQEQANFMGVMGNIFQQTGITRKPDQK